MRLLTPNQMRQVEQAANARGITYESLMELAGLGLAEKILRIIEKHSCKNLVFLCGKGNNAGDCFVAAKALAQNIPVTVCMVGGIPRTELAYNKFKEMARVTVVTTKVDINAAVSNADCVIDGVFGIGFRGELPDDIKHIFDLSANKIRVAVDLPSGGDGETGDVSEGTMHCDYTVTFGAGKTGMFRQPLSEYIGRLLFVDIGIPPVIFENLGLETFALTDDEVRRNLPMLHASDDTHKGDFGRLLCVCGSLNMPGAAIMCVSAALRCGVGTLCLASPQNTCNLLIMNRPEAMTLPLPMDEAGMLTEACAEQILSYAHKCSAVTLGCGLGLSDSTKRLVWRLIRELEIPIILDADGLNAITDCIEILQEAKSAVVLTPHVGELSRLLGLSIAEIQADRLAAARFLAERFENVTVVLKGAGTIVAAQNRAYINTTGNSGMSKGGSGDALAGVIGSLAAQGLVPEIAARIGVYLHGLAGDEAAKVCSMRAMLPSDTIAQIPNVLLSLEHDV